MYNFNFKNQCKLRDITCKCIGDGIMYWHIFYLLVIDNYSMCRPNS